MRSIISHNVIRQALSSMNAPKPLRIARPSSIVTSKNGTLMQQQKMIFNTGDILGYAQEAGFKGNNTLTVIDALQQCFCADVVITEVEHVYGRHEVIVSFIMIVTARDE